jgi:hypothetical protein
MVATDEYGEHGSDGFSRIVLVESTHVLGMGHEILRLQYRYREIFNFRMMWLPGRNLTAPVPFISKTFKFSNLHNLNTTGTPVP